MIVHRVQGQNLLADVHMIAGLQGQVAAPEVVTVGHQRALVQLEVAIVDHLEVMTLEAHLDQIQVLHAAVTVDLRADHQVLAAGVDHQQDLAQEEAQIAAVDHLEEVVVKMRNIAKK